VAVATVVGVQMAVAEQTEVTATAVLPPQKNRGCA